MQLDRLSAPRPPPSLSVPHHPPLEAPRTAAAQGARPRLLAAILDFLLRQAGVRVCPGAGVCTPARAWVPSAAQLPGIRGPESIWAKLGEGGVRRRASAKPEARGTSGFESQQMGSDVRDLNAAADAPSPRAAADTPLPVSGAAPVGAGAGLAAQAPRLRVARRSCCAAGSCPTAAAASLLHQTGAELGRRGAYEGRCLSAFTVHFSGSLPAPLEPVATDPRSSSRSRRRPARPGCSPTPYPASCLESQPAIRN